MDQNNQFTIYFSDGGVFVKFAVLDDVNQALQLIIALHQSSNVPHSIHLTDPNGVVIVDISNIPIDEH